MSRSYLDHNATSPLRPEARAAMIAAFETCGNASSVHREGRATRAAFDAARAAIARSVGARPANLVFTSGATEAANLALTPFLHQVGDNRPLANLLLCATEHPCALKGHRFGDAVEIAPVDGDGLLKLDALAEAIARCRGERFALALQAANNETGVIQNVAAAARLAHEAGGLVVCDATQAVGKIPVTLQSTGADIVFFSSHKLGGPTGVGALAFADASLHIPQALIRGGGQEGGRRAGTENAVGVIGFAAASEIACEALADEMERLRELRSRAEQLVLGVFPDSLIVGAGAPRLPNTLAFSIPSVSAQTLLIGLDLEGVAVSSGSACSSGAVRRSHVLEAMGLRQSDALRVSLGWSSAAKDVDLFGVALARVAGRVKVRSGAAA